MPEIVPLENWYPSMADKWADRLAYLESRDVKTVYQLSERTHWVHHHTVGGVDHDPTGYARIVARLHWDKWLRPGGYNLLVGTDGRIREMSGLLHRGVHAGSREWNIRGLGLGYQGDYRNRPPSDRMLAAAAELIGEYPLDQTYHRAVRPTYTSCPGDALIRLLPLEVGMASNAEVQAVVDAFVKARNEHAPDTDLQPFVRRIVIDGALSGGSGVAKSVFDEHRHPEGRTGKPL